MKDTELADLVGEYNARKILIADERRRCWEIERLLTLHLAEIGATAAKIAGCIVRLEPTTSYDKDRLTPLLEYEEIPDAELDAAWIPEKITPPSWNMTKVKALGKYSERVRSLIESAKITGEPTIKISEVKEEKR